MSLQENVAGQKCDEPTFLGGSDGHRTVTGVPVKYLQDPTRVGMENKMNLNEMNPQMINRLTDTTCPALSARPLRNKLGTKMTLISNIRKLVLAPALFMLMAAIPATAKADFITGPTRLNSNRSSFITLQTSGRPAADVTSVKLELANNPYFTGATSTTRYRDNYSNGWNSVGYVYFDQTVQGSTGYQTWHGRVTYYRGTVPYTVPVSSFSIASAGVAGNPWELRLNTYEVIGGSNGTNPTITMQLDGPAQVGGQWVDIVIDGPYAWALANFRRFYIPEGQTVGTVSWVVGTSRVFWSDKFANIHSYVNGLHNYVTLRIKR